MRKLIGMSKQRVFDHVRDLPSLEAKIGLLWKFVDRRDLFSVNTESAILDVLKDLYANEAFRSYDTLERLGSLKTFENELYQRGYCKVAKQVLDMLARQVRSVSDSRPQERSFHRYERRSSFYGCGYEDVDTIYKGFDEEGYRLAWKGHDELCAKLAKLMEQPNDSKAPPLPHDGEIKLSAIDSECGYLGEHEYKGNFSEQISQAVNARDYRGVEELLRRLAFEKREKSYYRSTADGLFLLGSALGQMGCKPFSPEDCWAVVKNYRQESERGSSPNLNLIESVLEVMFRYERVCQSHIDPRVDELCKAGKYMEAKSIQKDKVGYLNATEQFKQVEVDWVQVCSRI